MSAPHLNGRARQQGLVLVSSLLLLLVITILALAMFRSMGLGEKISGNVREKQRALHAAEVAEQYAEWWLTTANTGPAVACSNTVNVNLSPTSVLICNQASAIVNPVTPPWTTSSGAQVGFSYYPNSGTSNTTTTMQFVPTNGSYSNTYSQSPAFYIQYMGIAKDGGGNVYKIDAVGYGGNGLSVAVVESTFEMGSAVTNPGNP